MTERSLQNAVKGCRKAANVGYRIASAQYTALRDALSEAEESIKHTALEFSSSSAYFSGASDQLAQQLLDIQNSLNQLTFALHDDLEVLHSNLSEFSVTLFGRTMAGKSTLREILTEGDGSSIGTGAQRTTRDVREYEWNGLKITDVPGIGAFEGQEDEQIAFDAAKKADLILFLITDDAPQYAEAECFSKIIALGKPVICIMNVKAAISQEKNIKLAIRDIEKRFDSHRLEDIRDHFLSYGNNFGQNWRSTKFVYVHLKSAYLAQNTSTTAYSDMLYNISRIGDLKECITEVVLTKGEYYRERTFIDRISVPMLNTMESLISQSLLNSAQGRTILSKKRQLLEWKKSFERDGANSIKHFLDQIKGELYSEIADFAEEHYADPHADKAWEQLMNSRKIGDQCNLVITDLQEQCADQLQEISRSIVSELSYISNLSVNRTLKIHAMVDGRRIWNWGAIILEGGLTIGSIVASMFEITLFGVSLASPLGWAAAGVAVLGLGGSLLFKSRSRKEQEARRKMEGKLRDNVNENCERLKRQMDRSFSALVKAVESLSKEIDRINSVLFRLADTQKNLAWRLDDHLMALNMQIVKEALQLIGSVNAFKDIKSVARIPGIMSVFMLKDNTSFPVEKWKSLRSLMGEHLSSVFEANSNWLIVGRVMGKYFDRTRIRIEDKIGVAHIYGPSLTQYETNRIRLAQQFTKLAIQIEEV